MTAEHDPTEPARIPQPVRKEAFDAALAEAHRVLAERGYPLDIFAGPEFLEEMLDELATDLGIEPDPLN